MSESPFSEAVAAPSGESVCGFIACGFFEAGQFNGYPFISHFHAGFIFYVLRLSSRRRIAPWLCMGESGSAA